jgi:hypothetical protein
MSDSAKRSVRLKIRWTTTGVGQWHYRRQARSTTWIHTAPMTCGTGSRPWLEDTGIPARVIDELMGHGSGRRVEYGSPVDRVNRETSPEMLVRVLAALKQRLAVFSTRRSPRRQSSVEAPGISTSAEAADR